MAFTGSGLRIAGTLPVTAQSPSAIRMRGVQPHLAQLLEIILAADGALDDGDVDIGGDFLGVDERPVHDVRLLGDRDDRLVDVEQRHVAARAAVEPHRRQSRLFHRAAPFFIASLPTAPLLRVISSTA